MEVLFSGVKAITNCENLMVRSADSKHTTLSTELIIYKTHIFRFATCALNTYYFETIIYFYL